MSVGDAEALEEHRRWVTERVAPRREPEAVQQIADARAEPTLEELAAQIAELGVEEMPLPAVTLTGPRLAAYLRLESAAKAAHAAQAGLAATGQELREAFGELCKVVAG